MHLSTLLTSLALAGLAAATPVTTPTDVCVAVGQLIDETNKIERTVVCTATFSNCGASIATARTQAKCTQSAGTYNVNVAGCPSDAAENKYVTVLTQAGFQCK